MEFLEGTSLQDLVLGGPIELEQLEDLAVQVISGLDAAHKQGIIHRDIKPANIFVTSDGRAKILHFGLAKITAATQALTGEEETLVGDAIHSMTTGGGTLGTMPYMSPEQALGKRLDTRTDLFSFGVTVYEMATGKMPFNGDTTGMLFLAIVQQHPVAPVQTQPQRARGVAAHHQQVPRERPRAPVSACLRNSCRPERTAKRTAIERSRSPNGW
jgi:serine/threonine protein kinase